MHVDTALARQLGNLAGGVQNARGAGEMGDGDELRARRDCLLEGAEQVARAAGGDCHWEALHYESIAARADLPRIVVRRMIMVGDQDLIPRLQIDALDYD